MRVTILIFMPFLVGRAKIRGTLCIPARSVAAPEFAKKTFEMFEIDLSSSEKKILSDKYLTCGSLRHYEMQLIFSLWFSCLATKTGLSCHIFTKNDSINWNSSKFLAHNLYHCSANVGCVLEFEAKDLLVQQPIQPWRLHFRIDLSGFPCTKILLPIFQCLDDQHFCTGFTQVNIINRHHHTCFLICICRMLLVASVFMNVCLCCPFPLTPGLTQHVRLPEINVRLVTRKSFFFFKIINTD